MVHLFREALQKTGVNINPILLRLKDRENAENDRNFDRRSINFPLFLNGISNKLVWKPCPRQVNGSVSS